MQRLGRILPGVEVQLAADQGHQPLGVGLIVDRERGWVAEALRLPAQDADARGVERHDPHGPGPRADQHGHPRCHLAGRLVGEGDGQDLARQDVPRGEQVGDPVGQHPGLPGPRARHDEQRAARVDHRSPLLRVQPVQKGISSRSGHPDSLGAPADSRAPDAGPRGFRKPRKGAREAVHQGVMITNPCRSDTLRSFWAGRRDYLSMCVRLNAHFDTLGGLPVTRSCPVGGGAGRPDRTSLAKGKDA